MRIINFMFLSHLLIRKENDPDEDVIHKARDKSSRNNLTAASSDIGRGPLQRHGRSVGQASIKVLSLPIMMNSTQIRYRVAAAYKAMREREKYNATWYKDFADGNLGAHMLPQINTSRGRYDVPRLCGRFFNFMFKCRIYICKPTELKT